MISELLLNAVLHLFAMQASRLRGAELENARRRILAYLNNHVGVSDTEIYTGLLDELTAVHRAEPDDAILEHAAQMVARLKTLLHGHESHAAGLRFMELAVSSAKSALPRKIACLLERELGLSETSIERIFAFIENPEAGAKEDKAGRLLGGQDDSFRGRLAVLRLADEEELILVAPIGNEGVRLEGRPLIRGECQLVRPGQVLRDEWGNELYMANIVAAYEKPSDVAPAVTFRGDRLEFRFPGGKNGIRSFSFAEKSGRMVAIMGSSGAGKSTLMSILNGALRPASGALTLNGINVHEQPELLQGMIGFVPQDDLLFEDLTVFQNLYYAARLCMAQLSEEEIARRVNALLSDLGQLDIAHLKVGSPLDKIISGGQRKRLNIALELIREPPLLFLDEPTSGLSSADSELVMRLLKNQALGGKLVFVVIHQPSSKIFRSFDALWMLDQGGWPIFSGSPLEAVAYFRTRGDLPGAGEAICPGCGSVNPEQLLDIIEDKTPGPEGRPTQERRIAPETWHHFFRNYDAQRTHSREIADTKSVPETSLHRPGLWGQLRVFFARDLHARLANRIYLAITVLEPLLLGLLLGLVARGATGAAYSFHDNNNLHVFFFMSVMVSLFLGLTVSAEEICRDGRILRREQFLHLSWWSYINSKALYLALISGFQMLLYLAVAYPLIGLSGLFAKMWLILFSGALSASLLGLIISASFRSAVTIYILIPILLIPQMLLSGVVINYSDLIPPDARTRNVPRYANVLTPRWAHEALVVEQYAHNEYTRLILDPDARVRMAEYQLDYYLPELQSLAQSFFALRDQGAPAEAAARQLSLLSNEWTRLEASSGVSATLPPDAFSPDRYNKATAQAIERKIADIRRETFERRRVASAEKRAVETRLQNEIGAECVQAFRRKHTNRAIERQVLNLGDLEPVGVAKDGLFQRTLPIYQTPESRWGASHFLALQKRLGERLIPTYWFNLAAIFTLSFFFYLVLSVHPVFAAACASLGRWRER